VMDRLHVTRSYLRVAHAGRCGGSATKRGGELLPLPMRKPLM